MCKTRIPGVTNKMILDVQRVKKHYRKFKRDRAFKKGKQNIHSYKN